MPHLCQYAAIYQRLKHLNIPRKTPLFVVLKGGISLKIARFLPVFCPYRGVCTVHGISKAAQALLLNISGNKIVFLIIVNIIFLIAGCFVDANSAMYIFIPIMFPVAKALGINPIHFGILSTVNLAIGQVTPPVGVNLFVAIGVTNKIDGLRDKTKVTITSISKAVWPMILACVITLLLVSYVPFFSTCLLKG